MKTIVIQSNSYYKSTELLINEGREMGLNMVYAKNSDFEIIANGNNVKVLLQGKDLNGRNFDAIYFRTTLKYKESYMLISKFAYENGVYVLDYEGIQQYGEKLYNLGFMKKSELKIIPTYSSMDGKIPEKIDFDFPIIYKPAIGKQGIGVEKIKNYQDLKDKLENKTEDYLLQKFIKNDGDIRVIIIGNKIVGAMKRIAGKKDFRNNISLGGSGEKYDISTNLKKQIESFIKKSNVQYEFYGLDLIEDKENEGEFYFMEYDRSIQFDGEQGFSSITGINVSHELLKYINIKTEK